MQQVSDDFLVEYVSLVCPSCSTVFANPTLVHMGNITRDSVIEADLHRVLPDPAYRAGLLAMCPACIYTWWVSGFDEHYFLPQLVPDSPIIDMSKRFAHAVLSGRENGAHSLDRALLALNGCWCNREAHAKAGTTESAEYNESNHRWLSLAAQELEEALADEEWTGNRSRYQYMMGEVLRQLGEFESAIEKFDVVDGRSMLPKQLVDHQRSLAVAKDSRPTILPPFIVEEIFMPKPTYGAIIPDCVVADNQQSGGDMPIPLVPVTVSA